MNREKELRDIFAGIMAFAIYIVLFYGGAFLLKKLPFFSYDYVAVFRIINYVPVFIFLLFVIKKFDLMYILRFDSQTFRKGLVAGIPFFVLLALIASMNIYLMVDDKCTLAPFYQPVVFFIQYMIAALVEELATRGMLLNLFTRYIGRDSRGKLFLSSLFTSIIFGCMHLGNLINGTNAMLVLGQVIQTIFMGIFFGCIYIRSKNFYIPVFIHGIMNFCFDLQAAFQLEYEHTTEAPDTVGGVIMKAIPYCMVYVFFTLIVFRKSKMNDVSD